MNTPSILALATGVPSARHSQQEIFGEFIRLLSQKTGKLDARRARAMQVIFERSGVGFRHSVIGKGYFDTEKSTKTRNDVYMAEALPLGEKTIQCGLSQAGYTPQDIDDFIVVSCTGFNIPGLDLLLAERLGMRSDLRRTCVLGMGCYGAFPGLLRATEAATLRPGRRALVLALELCSLHVQLEDTAENVVSSALFSDGAAMVLVGDVAARSDSGIGAPRIIHSATHCDYKTLRHMSFNVTDHGFQMYLSSYVPELLAAKIDEFVDELLAHQQLTRLDVRFWGIHPGSSKIVDYVQARLGLSDTQVECSHAVLYQYGNMSSATILFVLEHIQRCNQPSPGDYGVLLAFGPGLTMEGLLVRW
ncbi:MAG: type III polyketide synthase [Chloroflexi bacterium]|nr:type III polyketide synthase [Chloroflexota bacterium]